MKQQSGAPNWMNNPTMLEFYRKVQAAGGILEPDSVYLSDVSLGRYPVYKLKDLEISEHLRNFLTKTGLPDRFLDWRSPDEERDESEKQVAPGIVFWISCLRIEEIKREKYLVIGEARELSRSCSISGWGTLQEVQIWNKGESCAYMVVELKTETVWRLVPFYDENTLTFVNSSLEQYLLSMAYWRTFYQEFTQKIQTFREEHPDKTELDYVFKNQKNLYRPFRECLKALDPAAEKKRTGYWKFMCDLSLL